MPDTVASFSSDSTDLSQQTLANIATHLPGATAIFRARHLDFCCHGQVSLQAATATSGIDLPPLLQELQSLQSAAATVTPTETAAMIDHILARYHDVHRKELPELIRLARRVEEVHRRRASVPVGLANALEGVLSELGAHMEKEEQVLFPMMKVNGCPVLAPPTAKMRTEHDTHGEHLRQLQNLTANFVPPADACATWRALYANLDKFAADLMEHIHLENNILFPRFDGSHRAGAMKSAPVTLLEDLADNQRKQSRPKLGRPPR